MNKKILAVLVALIAVAFAAVVFASAASFKDVPDDAYYADAAERMAEVNILSGYGDGYFYGNAELTRAQFAALACKLLGKVDEAVALAGKTDFTDVPETHWSTGYVNYAAANGIINGDGDGCFRPDDSVKYEEAIKVVVCLLTDKEIEIDAADWSKHFIEEGVKLGITDNLIGKKGEFMMRSDIAVIADNAYTVLKQAEDAADTTTTKKATAGGPTSTTAKKDEEREPEATTTQKPSTTTAPAVITVPPIIYDVEYLPPPPPGPDEGPEF